MREQESWWAKEKVDRSQRFTFYGTLVIGEHDVICTTSEVMFQKAAYTLKKKKLPEKWCKSNKQNNLSWREMRTISQTYKKRTNATCCV